MGFPRQEYCSGLPRPPPGDLSDPGIKPMSPVSPALQVDSWPTESVGKPPLYRLLAEIFFDFLFVDYPALLEQMMTRTGSTFHLLLVTDADLFFHWLEVHHTTHQTAREAGVFRLAMTPRREHKSFGVFATQHGKDMVFQASEESVPDSNAPEKGPSKEKPWRHAEVKERMREGHDLQLKLHHG